MSLPELAGVLTGEDLMATGRAIAAVQQADGAIPWFVGGHTDPWDHVECAMALDVVGLHAQARAAYGWLAARQRRDGSWAARYEGAEITQAHADANFCAYIAVGIWHHHLRTGDDRFLHRLWPTVRAALDLVVSMQLPGGQVAWADGAGGRADEALLTGSASIYQSLRAGLAIAQRLDQHVPDWELAAGRLGHALRHHQERFADRSRFSMDWYYPVLGGAVRGVDAAARIDGSWETFWVDGLGVRCVSDRPWVTGAETCELAIALATIGRRQEAIAAVAAMQHLRAEDGSYWTGYVFEDDARWPVERSTWTGAAVVLAADAIAGEGSAARVFHGDDLPVGLDPADVLCGDELAMRPDDDAVVCQAG